MTIMSAAQNHEEEAVGRLRQRLQARFSERTPATAPQAQ